MVGTYRSKGCKTCIRRKVKCGAEKPICFRCITMRIPCEGYERGLRWVDDLHSSSRRASRDKSSSTSTSSQSPQKGLSGPRQEIYTEYFKEKFLHEFANHGAYSYAEWMGGCLSTTADDVSNLAINALMSLFFARMHGNPESAVVQSNAYYGRALRQLQLSIESPNYTQMDITPAALALTYYELVAYHTEGGWLHHAGGIGKLMELNGPHRYQDYPEHGYFLLARPIILVSAMTIREPTFLDSPEWKTIPWERHPQTKTPSHYMQDLWAEGPSVGRDMILIAKDPTMLQDILSRLTRIIQSLVDWRWQWEKANPCTVTKRAVDPLTSISVDTSGNQLFETVFWYQNLTQMMEIMDYNVNLITLTYCAACIGHPKLVESVIDTIPGSDDQEVTNALGFPRYGTQQTYGTGDICRSIEYALHQGSGSIGAFFVLLPLRLCVLTFALQDSGGDYRQWIASICDKIASQSGFAFAQRLKYLPQIHMTRDLKEEKVIEENKHNITNTTLAMAPIEEYMRSANESWSPTAGGSFPASVGSLAIDGMIKTRKKISVP